MPCQTILLDGAQGTRLQQFGLPLGTSSPQWNITNPSKVTEMHSLYHQAGSQILLTNTFGARDPAEFEAAWKCIEPFSKECRIVGSIGPHTEVRHAHILASFIDFYVLETFSDLFEAHKALNFLTRIGKPVVVSFAWLYDDDFHLRSGTTVKEFMNEVSKWPIFAIGANCSLGSKRITELALRFADQTDIDLWIKANAGQPRIVGDRAIYDQTPQEFASDSASLIGTVRYLGGCCGTDERFIKQLRTLYV
ncbi:MAG TPA: homocysteine S-methyltransferase family protein [Acidobacteriota bacterium]|nr:homocysteine S-methyltransferase family protein [Acidobacteriota bacterium]